MVDGFDHDSGQGDGILDPVECLVTVLTLLSQKRQDRAGHTIRARPWKKMLAAVLRIEYIKEMSKEMLPLRGRRRTGVHPSWILTSGLDEDENKSTNYAVVIRFSSGIYTFIQSMDMSKG